MTGVMAKPVSAQSAQRCRYKHLPTPPFPTTCLLRTCYCLALIPSISLEYPDTLLLCSCYGPATLLLHCYSTATLFAVSCYSPDTLLPVSCYCPATVLRVSCYSPGTLLVPTCMQKFASSENSRPAGPNNGERNWVYRRSVHHEIPAPPAQTTRNESACTAEACIRTKFPPRRPKRPETKAHARQKRASGQNCLRQNPFKNNN